MDFKHQRLLNSHWKMFLYFLYNNRFRIALLGLVELILGIVYPGEFLMSGVTNDDPFKMVPIRWFFIMLSAQLIIGDSSRKMVKSFFPTHIRFSLTNIIISVFLTSSLVAVFSGLLVLFKCQYPFSIYTFLVIWVLTVSFALLSLFIKPIYLHLLSVILLICVTYLDWPKFLSATMIVRFQTAELPLNCLFLGIFLLVIMSFTIIRIKKIDFYL